MDVTVIAWCLNIEGHQECTNCSNPVSYFVILNGFPLMFALCFDCVNTGGRYRVVRDVVYENMERTLLAHSMQPG